MVPVMAERWSMAARRCRARRSGVKPSACAGVGTSVWWASVAGVRSSAWVWAVAWVMLVWGVRPRRRLRSSAVAARRAS